MAGQLVIDSKTPQAYYRSIKKMARVSPWFKDLTKVIYRSPREYLDYKEVMTLLAMKLVDIEVCFQAFPNDSIAQVMDRLTLTHKHSLTVVNQAVVNGLRPFWLDKNLLTAFLNTQLPKKLHTIKRLVPVGLIFLPRLIKSPENQYLEWILFYHYRPGDRISDLELMGKRIEWEHHPKDTLYWCTNLGIHVYASAQHLEIEDNQLKQQDYPIHIDTFDTDYDYQSEIDFLHQITSLVINTILYLQLEKIDCQTAIKAGSKGFSKQSKARDIEPLILGLNYQIKQDYQPNDNPDSVAIPVSGGQSKSSHWRSGHWRNQPYGNRENPEYQIIWIEPTFVVGQNK